MDQREQHLPSDFYRNKFFAGPMMKVSNLPFRLLCLECGADGVFGPAINCEAVIASQVDENNIFYLGNPSKNEIMFRTNEKEKGKLVFQLFSNDSSKAVRAVEKIYPFVSAIDINCGCPSNFATNKGRGSALMNSPEIISDIISTLRRNFPPTLPLSVKFRIFDEENKDNPEQDENNEIETFEHTQKVEKPLKIESNKNDMNYDIKNDDDVNFEKKNIHETIHFASACQMAGASAIILHGRPKKNRHKGEVKYDEMKIVFDELSRPSNNDIAKVGNGGIKSRSEGYKMMQIVNCDSVMISSEALKNPRVFQSETVADFNASVATSNARRFVDICVENNCSMNECRFYLLEMLSKQQEISNSIGYRRLNKAKTVEAFQQILYDEDLFHI